ncbi:hypothetical protein LOK49_LG03G00464 [Camellia lanceoleosa]|uniref:Uncharacterized protein n=1 Tax=Camellia lanceoleosa TaxID=1840588 RepID=A0ACC0IE87_9ERIC|nr:hypothetical protein LOK49_LG03G00464 [Camellia lanceoleosa]
MGGIVSNFEFALSASSVKCSLDSVPTGSNFGSPKVVKDSTITDLFATSGNIRCMRASSKGMVGGETGDDFDEAFQDMVGKTKKILTMQKSLLEQTNSNSSCINDKHNGHVFSGSYAHSTADEAPDVLSIAAIRGYYEGEKNRVAELTVEKDHLAMPFPKEFEENGSVIDLPNTLPSSFPKASEIDDPIEERIQELTEESLEVGSDEGHDPGDEDTTPPPLAGANVMNIILVAAECAPSSKTGGLGDVARALPKALARRGHRVMVVAPKYGDYAELQIQGYTRSIRWMGRYYDSYDVDVSYFQAYIDGVDFVFVDSYMFCNFESNIYGGDRVRMVLFCKAAVEVPWHIPCGGVCYGDGNLDFIANDWHTSLLPVYLKAYYRGNGLMKYAESILVIHNIAHQGRGPVEDFAYVDLPEYYSDHFKMYDTVGSDHFNIFAAGLKMADRVVTVSHGYAWELKTSEGGWGLHSNINENDWKLRGIVNGIDMKDWNPQLDVHLTSDGYTNYSLDTLHAGKPQRKAALQNELGLPVHDDVPLIGFIGRLDYQKGIDLIAEAMPWIVVKMCNL